MASAKINDWMQVIGIFALVASLIFVGLQMRQTQEIALSNAYQSRITTSVEMITSRAANEKGGVAWLQPQNEEELELLTPEEQWAGEQLAMAVLLVWDNIHFQFESGFISEEIWLAALTDMRTTMRSLPIFRIVMMMQVETMRPSFRAIVVQQLNNEQRE